MRTRSTLSERILCLSMASVSSEKLERGINSFKDFLINNASNKDLDYSCTQSWTYSLKPGADGGPELANRTAQPEHVFWECPPDKGASWRLKITSHDIVFNYRKNKIDDSGSWSDFKDTAMFLIQILKKSLEISAWKTMIVTYFFIYSYQTIDDCELARADWIEVKDLLQPFRLMPHSDGFECFCPTYLWEQSWSCKDKDDDHFKVYSRLETNHGRPSEKRVPKGQQPLEIHLFMSVEPSNEQLKGGIPWDKMQTVLKDNYYSMLTDKSLPIMAGDFK